MQTTAQLRICPPLLRFLLGRIATAREQVGWSQADLADAVGTEHWTVSRYETGRMLPWVVMLCRLSQALRVSSDYLLALDEPAKTREGKR